MSHLSHRLFHRSVLMLGIVVSLLVAACGSTPIQSVKVAVDLPVSIGIGKAMLNGVQLALDEAHGKAGNVTVELRVIDTSAALSASNAGDIESGATKEAIADPSVVAYLGPATSGQARVSMPLLNAVPLTQIAPTVTWPGLTKPGFGAGEPGIYYPTGQRHFFRLVPSDDVQGLMATRWMNQLGVKTVYIVTDASTYSEGLGGIFEASAADQKLTVLAHDHFDPTTAKPEEIAALVSRIVAAKPDALYFPAGAAVVGDITLLSGVHAADPKLMIVGSDGFTALDLGENGKALDGIYATNVSLEVGQLDSAASFSKSYEAAYGMKPPAFALSCYESMKVLLRAIAQAETPTRAGVLTAMGKLGDITGALGTWHFDTNGDTSLTTISGLQLKDGQWATITVIR